MNKKNPCKRSIYSNFINFAVAFMAAEMVEW